MTTITLWLLIISGGGSRPMLALERFATAQECQRVGALIDKHTAGTWQCIQATVVKP